MMSRSRPITSPALNGGRCLSKETKECNKSKCTKAPTMAPTAPAKVAPKTPATPSPTPKPAPVFACGSATPLGDLKEIKVKVREAKVLEGASLGRTDSVKQSLKDMKASRAANLKRIGTLAAKASSGNLTAEEKIKVAMQIAQISENSINATKSDEEKVKKIAFLAHFRAL